MCYTLALASLVVFSGCKKDDDKATPAATVKAKLMANTWKFKTLSVGGVDVTNQFIAACDRDNTLKFDATNAVTGEGATACTPPSASTDPYFLRTNDTEIGLVSGGDTSFLKIVTLDASNLVVEEPLSSSQLTYIK